MDTHYDVLSPWAEIDPVPLNGLTARLKNLNGKAIGLFVNHKPASPGVQAVVERRLRERFPATKISVYRRFQPDPPSKLDDEDEFKKWASGVDAVILGQGD